MIRIDAVHIPEVLIKERVGKVSKQIDKSAKNSANGF